MTHGDENSLVGGMLGFLEKTTLGSSDREVIDEQIEAKMAKWELEKRPRSSSPLPGETSTRHDDTPQASTSRADTRVNEGERHAELGSSQGTGDITPESRSLLEKLQEKTIVDLAQKVRRNGSRARDANSPVEKIRKRFELCSLIKDACNDIRVFKGWLDAWNQDRMAEEHPNLTDGKIVTAARNIKNALNDNFFDDDSEMIPYRQTTNTWFEEAGLS